MKRGKFKPVKSASPFAPNNQLEKSRNSYTIYG
jgi:hypothetical protein